MINSSEWTGNPLDVRGLKFALISISFFEPLNQNPPPPPTHANLMNRPMPNSYHQMAPSLPKDSVSNSIAKDSNAQLATPVRTPINAPPVLPSTPFIKNVSFTNASNNPKTSPGPNSNIPANALQNNKPNSIARTVNTPDTRPTLPTPVKAVILYKLIEGYNPDIMSWNSQTSSLKPYEGKYRSQMSTCSWHSKCSMRQNLPFSGGPVVTASIWNSDATNSRVKPPATSKLQRRVNKLLKQSTATSLEKVYNQHWSSFSKFMRKALKRQALPAKSDDIYLYVTHLHSLNLKASTICNHL